MTGPDGLQTVNVLVTDVVGSTSTLVRAGADAANAQRLHHDTIVRNIVEVFGGSIVKSTGDGALALLPSADHLVRAGSAVQEAAGAAGFPMRVGMSTGDAMVERGDLFGEPVVVASRLCDVCPVGAVFIDATSVEVRGNRHEPAVSLHDRLMLRGFDAPRDVWSVTGRGPGTVPAAPPAELAIGRDHDVATIREALDSATRSTLVVLAGEPGIGKTHLARAVVGSDDGALFVGFSSSERDGLVTWCAALDDVVGEIPVGLLAALGPDVVSRAAGLLPSIAARMPIDPQQRAADAGRDPTLDALVAVLELVGRQRVVVLDDVQWAGPTASAFIDRLLSSTSGMRLIATSRLPVPADITRIAGRLVTVGGLSDDAVGELLRGRGVAVDDLTAVTRRAEGNPLLALFASGGAPSADGDPVAEAFLTLPPDQLDVLGVAGLLGRRVDIVLLEQLTSTPAATLSLQLHAAVDAGLLADDPLSFVHDLVRDAAAATLPMHRREVLHAAAATALQRRGDVLGAVDHVLRGFGALDADEAVEAVAAGCELLAERLAFEDLLAVAVRLHSVVVADQRCRPRHEAAALLLQSWAYELLGDVPRHKEAALAAGRIAQQSGAALLLVEAALSRAGYGMAGVPDPDTLELLDAALDVVPNDDAARRARLIGMRAFYLVNYEGRGAEARAASLGALTLARDADDDEALAEVLANRMFVLLASSDVVEQVALADELRRVTPRLPVSRRHVAWASLHRNEGALRLQLADRAGFATCHVAVRTSAANLNSWLLTAVATMWDGLAALLDGDPDSAQRHTDAMVAIRPSERNLVASGAGMHFATDRWRGRRSGRAADMAAYAVSQPGLPLASGLAAVGLALEHDRRAQAVLDELLARDAVLADDSTLGAQLAAITEACLLTGTAVPPDVATALLPFAGQLLVTGWGIDVPGAAERFLALIAAQAGDRGRAAEAFDRASALEAHVSAALPLRTQVWRHAVLGDVGMPDVPAPLAGLASEADTLRAARS